MKDAHGSFSYRVHSAIYRVKCNTCHRYEKLIRFSIPMMAGEFFWLHPFSSGDLDLVIFILCVTSASDVGAYRPAVESSCPWSYPHLSVDMLA